MMNMKTKNIILLLTVAFFAAGCADMSARIAKTSAEASSAGRKHDEVAINKLAASITSSDLSQDHLRSYSSNTITTLFATLRTISFYSPDNEGYASRLGIVFKEKVRRKDYTDEDVSQVFKAYLMAGLFEEAAVLEKEFSDKSLPNIPQIIPSGNSPSAGWSAYKISDNGAKAESVSLTKDAPRVIMVMRPTCEFAVMAAKAIFADKDLGPVFRANGFMLTRYSTQPEWKP
jgi:hypothetical protein